ncbi:MAG: flagellar basal body L-ring protein FlgH [Betaproteobacteria bacterium]|jgi:flagellar L-ring protein precursor FlgH|nr:flagellar basal body L-ring protein FlgH [Betaproteobacteria bacterium]NBZ98297.1 flagellar basal body L-ring protein FlgH [Betaproteobacteria bacterium]NDD01122.1 flagellar basal body L-ring protein FlgH [Betaproteobacteria bacterium]NDD24485.1 flagellar basal body L-ring protein FlgH [Betaproteobacteria bacterium]NDF80219.1 flagellar basal body L-ring protein FlgH [Betaproteobacteria bacterium]
MTSLNQFQAGFRRIGQWLAATLLLGLSACTTALPPQAMTHSPMFEPVYPVQNPRDSLATGAIYVGRQSDSWFGKGRNFQVGDVITVLLNESTQAARTQNGTVSRESSNDMIPKGLQNYGANLGGFMNGINLLGGKVSNKGTGAADQQASLSGSVAVSVVEVMPNGNLVLRGEKQLALTEGSEVIQVAGIIRPDDVAPNNTVQSRRLANAQIAYRGTGDLANATKAGWGTSALLKIWPF